jgi:uncharacterized coiled-coil protein SlyX
MKPNAAFAVGIALFLGVAGLTGRAQAQTSSDTPTGQSLGQYARQVRKEPDTKGKPKVFDNDNLPKSDKLSIVGNATTAPESAPAPEEKPAEAGTANSSGGNEAKAQAATPPTDTSKMDQSGKEAAWKQWGDRIAEQQKQIDLNQRELDVLQREYQVRAAAMYADVGNRLRNSAEWDKQDAQYKQQIAEKQKSLEDAKQKLEELQEQARKAGVPSSIREP